MRTIWLSIFFVFLPGLGGCTRMVTNSLLRPAIDNLQSQTDIELVCEGTSSFLLMLDSMVASNPEDKELRITATKAFSGYAAALDVCDKPQRATTVSIKARQYGLSLLWPDVDLHTVTTLPLPNLQNTLKNVSKSDVGLLFWAGSGWATWIRHQQGSPASLAQLIRVEQIMLRVLELDATYYHGAAHLFLGVYHGSKPQLLGGKPELSRHHFEQALAISNREYLPTLVLYAKTYGRMSFDRDLFSSLLQEVLDFPLASRPDLGLANQLAKRDASILLSEIEQFF